MKRYKTNKGTSPDRSRASYGVNEAIFDFVLGFFWNLIKLPFKTRNKRQETRNKIDQEEIIQKWQKIKEMMELGGESHFKQAVIEADKLFDHVLKSLGFGGETFADRLRAARNQFSADTYDALWQAHKIRNQITHEINYELLAHEAKEAVSKLEKGMKEINVL